MKITSLLSIAAAGSLAVFLSTLLFAQGVLAACSAFALLFIGMIVTHEYTPRPRLVFATEIPANTVRRLEKSAAARRTIRADAVVSKL